MEFHTNGKMKTTLTLPDDLFRQAKARAVLRGQTFGRFLEQVLQKDLAATADQYSGAGEWMNSLPPLPRGAAADLQRVVETPDFRSIDRAMWE